MKDYLANRFNYGFFEGENLWIGNFGHFFIVLSFVMLGLATYSFVKAEIEKNKRISHIWQQIASYAFYTHFTSIIVIFSLLFYMIFTHKYEYHYVWSHSSNDLPVYYIISSFWEGQEGSFLLWQFWIAVLGLIIIKKETFYKNAVLSTISFAQFLLSTMVLGIYVFNYKIGVNPFSLLRNVMVDAPIFSNPNYLELIKDGNGLNLLLQNYWMVIHPPVLFLGFASTLVPFAYAIASLWKGEYQKWVHPTLVWSLLSIFFLGTGIFMGGAWAYESLSFGGFWAWDPVENASLVPWLLILAGSHTLLAYKYTKRGIFISYVFILLTFILILYSTFLTRSGILGDTSVHSFTDLGMTGQLLAYIILLSLPSLLLLVYRYKNLPKVEGEESFYSREFWMFIGSLIFIVSAFQISWDTSLPVINKIFSSNMAIGSNAVAHYNKVQIVIAILLAIGAGFVQYLVYNYTKKSTFFKYLLYSLGLSLGLTIICCYYFKYPFIIKYSFNDIHFSFISSYWVLMFAAIFALSSNIFYIIFVVRSRFWQWTGAISHIGFGLFLIGILISQGRQETISINKMGMGYGDGFDAKETQTNIFLPQGDTIKMGNYNVSYVDRIPEGKKEKFKVYYVKKNPEGIIVDEFFLYPDAQVSSGMGLVSNPDTKHTFSYDVFTHVSSIPEKPSNHNVQRDTLSIGDTIFTSNCYVILKNLIPNPPNSDYTFNDTLLGIGAELEINTFNNKHKTATPLYIVNIKNGKVQNPSFKDFKNHLEFKVLQVNPSTNTILLETNDSNDSEDFIIMKAIVFPYINLLWIGGIIMLLGTLLSAVKRYRQKATNES